MNILLIILTILVVILIVLNVIILIKIKKPDNSNLDFLERLGRFELNINKDLGSFKNDITKDMTNHFDKVNDKLETKLNEINNKVNSRIDENFEKTNKTFINVLERLSKIDEAQKKIDNLSVDIVSLENILTDKKTRGIFGEVNLYNILKNIFGDKNDLIYKTQFKLSNGYIADSVIFAPEPLKTIAIDSKFPLENYRIMVDKKRSDIDRNLAFKQFKSDVKKHIDDISYKYIIEGETSNQAMMFIPAEAIFAEINAYHPDLVEYAYKKRVWLTSPTTLISTLTMIMMIIQNIERDKYTSIIHEELNKLGVEFTRFKDRFDKLSKSVLTVNKDIESFSITTDKIKKKFDSISSAKIKDEILLDNEED
ncbi:MAG: DNA recombination protein RmuC [Bacilli bacterium]|nr:DNA recombination protein RmuC [Bacilli bacterium]